jgi:hypothetical protein
MVVNDAPRDWTARWDIRGAEVAALWKYQVASAGRDRPGLRIDPQRRIKLERGGAVFEELLPAMSLTVFSSYQLSREEAGIIAERAR